METSAGAATVKVVEPQTEPAHALTVAEPVATASAAPRLLASLVMATIVASEELHVTDDNVWVVPSVKVPVAMKRCVAPRGTVGAAGAHGNRNEPCGSQYARLVQLCVVRRDIRAVGASGNQNHPVVQQRRGVIFAGSVQAPGR